LRDPARAPYARLPRFLLVNDGGPDRSDEVIRRLSASTPFVRAVWLSRNFGQHAATIAGMSSTGSEWIVTLDEDGQFDPADIGRLLDVALGEGAQLVYATATNPPPHGLLRNVASRVAKTTATPDAGERQPCQLHQLPAHGGRDRPRAAAYVGPGVYLDVALSWAFGRVSFCPVEFRRGSERPLGIRSASCSHISGSS